MTDYPGPINWQLTARPVSDALAIAAVWLALLICMAWEMCVESDKDTLPCGHPASAVRGNGRTWYCGECEREA